MITIGDQSWFRYIQTNPPHYESALGFQADRQAMIGVRISRSKNMAHGLNGGADGGWSSQTKERLESATHPASALEENAIHGLLHTASAHRDRQKCP